MARVRQCRHWHLSEEFLSQLFPLPSDPTSSVLKAGNGLVGVRHLQKLSSVCALNDSDGAQERSSTCHKFQLSIAPCSNSPAGLENLCFESQRDLTNGFDLSFQGALSRDQAPSELFCFPNLADLQAALLEDSHGEISRPGHIHGLQSSRPVPPALFLTLDGQKSLR